MAYMGADLCDGLSQISLHQLLSRVA